MKALLTLLSISAAWAQTSLAPPQVGFTLDSGNAFRPVYGIAGNFVMGSTAATGVVSAAFSGSFGWMKTDSALLVTDRQGQVLASMDAPDGPALFAFTQGGAPSLAFLASTNALIQWNAGTFQQVARFDASGVVSIAAPDAGHAALIVQRDDGLWDVRLLLATGEIASQTALPGLRAPVLMLATGDLIFTDADTLVIRRSNGAVAQAFVPVCCVALQQMGDGWIQLGKFALRITEGREQLYTLPEVEQ